MSDLVNPFLPGQPVADAAHFFGRSDALAWARENLVRGRRVFVLYAPRRMGKTSFLLQLAGELPPDTLAVYWSLKGQRNAPLEQLVADLASVVRTQLPAQLQLTVDDPSPDAAETTADWLVERFWPALRRALGAQVLLLLLDDLGAIATHGEGRLASFVQLLARLRAADEDLALVSTFEASEADQLARRYPTLFGGALFWGLGPLTGDDAIQLVTWPVENVVAYDFGVPRRIVELTSGHPHYLQLVCYALFERCAPQGWVNQRDLDLVVESLIRQELAEFAELWDSLDALERVSLVAIAALRGGRGVATRQEVRTALERARLKVAREEVQQALNRLVQRGILQQLGALSFRFRVDLFRLWIGHRFDLPELVADARADRVAARNRARQQGWWALRRKMAQPATSDRETEAPAATPARPGQRLRWWWALGVIPVAVGLIWLATSLGGKTGGPPQGTTVSLGTATATATDVATEPAPAPTPQPSQAPTSALLATREVVSIPSPTSPRVVTGALPAIAYQVYATDVGNWDIWLMNYDGTGRVQLTRDPEDDTSPAWSPDGSQIAFVSYRDGNAEIYLASTSNGPVTNLTQHPAKDWTPSWSPDGEWIAFGSLRDSLYWELYLMRPDGSDVTRLTWWDDASDLWPTWAPDGSRLAFASKRDGNWELYVVNRDGSGLSRLTDHPGDDTSPAWSPDGTRIAFESTRDGNVEIYIMPAAGGDAVNVSNEPLANDHGPSWSPDGHRLVFYSNRDREWDIYAMNDDGTDVILLTGEESNDQLPAWRP